MSEERSEPQASGAPQRPGSMSEERSEPQASGAPQRPGSMSEERSEPLASVLAELAAGLPGLPRDDDGPVFAEAWQAEAFAMTITLTEAGVFTWPEWVDALTAAIAAAQAGGDPDLGDTYYQHWSSALEGLCAAKGLVGVVGVDERQEQWRRAYLNTPHGQPVDLEAGA